MTTATVKMARKISKRMEATYADYLDMCDEDRGMGYTVRHCEHGKSRWTPHDNICGYCEDGVTMSDTMTRRVAALSEARDRMAKVTRLTDLACQLRQECPGINIDSIIDEISRLREI